MKYTYDNDNAVELAHWRTLEESSDICNCEDDMYEEKAGICYLVYKDEIQTRFDYWYNHFDQLMKEQK